jgi:hypothetical protein
MTKTGTYPQLYKYLTWCLLSAFLFPSHPARSQGKWTTGIQGGIAATKVWCGYNDAQTGYYFQAAPFGGLFAARKLGEALSVSLELNYDKISTKQDGLLPIDSRITKYVPEGNTYFAYITNKITLDYISFTESVKCVMPGTNRLYFTAGLYVAWLARALGNTYGNSLLYSDSAGKKVVITGNMQPLSSQHLDNAHSIQKQLQPVNLGASTGIGLFINIGGKQCGIEGRYTFGILNISKSMRSTPVLKTDHLSLRFSYPL